MASAEASHHNYHHITIETPRIKQLVVTNELIELIPSILGNDFFIAPENPIDDHVYTAELCCAKTLFNSTPPQVGTYLGQPINKALTTISKGAFAGFSSELPRRPALGIYSNPFEFTL
ncbi:hypothetical protein BGX30_000902, partial [Mortierella sp. GBA39]